MDEFQLINYLTKDTDKKSRDIIKSIGDDTAVVKYNKNTCLLLTTDSLVENIHFSLKYKINKSKLLYFLGWKALAVNISDINAMGGIPSEALISLNIPSQIKPYQLKIIYKGLNECCKKYKVKIIGGNVTESIKDFIITVALTGKIDKDKILYRDQAKAGDYIYIQKNVGFSKAGFNLLKKGYNKLNELVLAHLKPEPDIMWRNSFKKNKINSAIDISDGLLGDLNHILRSSKKGAELYLEKIKADIRLKKMFPTDYLEYILYGGEDYKIVFTSPDIINNKDFLLIGKVKSNKGISLIYQDKKVKIKDPAGFLHFG